VLFLLVLLLELGVVLFLLALLLVLGIVLFLSFSIGVGVDAVDEFVFDDEVDVDDVEDADDAEAGETEVDVEVGVVFVFLSDNILLNKSDLLIVWFVLILMTVGFFVFSYDLFSFSSKYVIIYKKYFY